MKNILTLLFILFTITALHGQNKKVADAVQLFHDGNYDDAYLELKEVLADPGTLSGDYLPLAYQYLANSRMQLLRVAMEGGDNGRLKGMQNALMESYLDYKQALETAADKLRSDILQDMSGLYHPLIQTALVALNASYDRNQAEKVRASALQTARSYLEAARDITPTYLVSDLLGQALLAMGDSLGARDSFNESIEAYRKESPMPPDFLMAYVFFRKALIERYSLINPKMALATLQAGEMLMNKEYERVEAMGGLTNLAASEYQNGLDDLISFELDIYLSEPSLIDEAILRFREVITVYPNDYDILIAYGNLLEKTDMQQAIEVYETAASMDGSRDLGFFNLGAAHNNLAADLYEQALARENDDAAERLYDEANRHFVRAYTNMEKAYRLNPDHPETIRALVQIAITLGLEEEAAFYKKKETELGGQ
jgi:tetratricopeptide (TPR) repeat protein